MWKLIRKQRLLSVAGAGVLAVALAACGSSGSNGSGGSSGTQILLGTTDSVTAVDPAGSYDIGSWNIQYNVFQTLMQVPPNGNKPVPNAANCAYDNAQQITCKLDKGLTFSNGDPLTSADVKFSFERNIAINDPNGSSVLLGSIEDTTNPDHPKLKANAIETPDAQTVVFHLNGPDTTFMFVLSTATTSIVDHKVYPADKLLPDSKSMGSGPYTLAQYKPGQQAVFEANPKYKGTDKLQNKRVFVQYFNDPAPLKQAVESGQVDVAWRTLSPTDLVDLKSKSNVQVLTGKGSEFRYWVWQLSTKTGKQLAVRQAVAQLFDRDAIVKNAYDGTVKPAYSIVPPGFAGQKDSFQQTYGSPSVAKAKAILQRAGVKTPVAIRLGYTPSHYGPNAVDEANELKQQLNSSGLFKATTNDAEWEQYQTLYKQGAYDLFILGWYPDFLDADNYLTPFIRDGGFFANHYKNATVDQLLTKELGQTDPTARAQTIGQLQDIVAKDVPLIPSWNGQNVAVAGSKVTGVEGTLDPTYIFRYWMIGKK